MVHPKLTALISEMFKVQPSQITLAFGINSTPKWDSLGHLQLIMEIEKAFHIQFQTKEIPELSTVDLIQKALAAKGVLNARL